MKRKSNPTVFVRVTDLPLSPLSFFKKTLEIKKHGPPKKWLRALKDQTALLYFEEPSTRTRLSFELAAQRLGLKTVYVEGASSSSAKGESHTELMRFVSQYRPATVIIRSSSPVLPPPPDGFSTLWISAGLGQSGHPTQALLDYVTLLEHLGKVSPLRIGFCGDVSRSRVFRSHLQLAQLLPNIQVGVYAPFPFGDVTGISTPIRKFNDKTSFLNFCEVLCILRNQAERPRMFEYQGGAKDDFIQFYRIRHTDIPPHVVVLHPGPIHFETDMDRSVLTHPNSLIERQVENGIYTRMCLLGILLEKVTHS